MTKLHPKHRLETVFQGLISFGQSFWSSLSGQGLVLAIDMGSANTSVYVPNHGIVLTEPTVMARDTKNEKVIAIGETARQMLGRTPDYIQIVKPFTGGIANDPVLLEIFLKYIVDQVVAKIGIYRNVNFKVVASIPSNITQVDSRSLEQLFVKIGASKVYLIPQLYAAAIGSKVPFRDIKGQMLVQVGDSGTEIGVFSLGKLVFTEVLPQAGAKFTQNIIQIIRDEFNLLIGQNTAEDCKIWSLANTVSPGLSRDKQKVVVRGRDLTTGLPRTINVDQSLIHDSIAKDIVAIGNTIKKCIESLPPEIAVDIQDNGINLSGGGALIASMDEVIARLVETNVVVVSDPISAVIRGCGVAVENLKQNMDVLQDSGIS